MQAKDIEDKAVLSIIARTEREEHRWTFYWDVAQELGVDRKLILAKANALIRRGLMTGCTCGCRGDFELTAAGAKALEGT